MSFCRGDWGEIVETASTTYIVSITCATAMTVLYLLKTVY